MKRSSLFLIAALLFTGCATTGYSSGVRANAERYANAYPFGPNDPSMVSVLRAAPSDPYDVIGEVFGSSQIESVDYQGIADEMRKKAAWIGGDAILIESEEKALTGTRTNPGSLSTNYNNQSTASGMSTGTSYQTSQQSGGQNFGLAYQPTTTEQIWTKTVKGKVIRYKSDQIPRGVKTK